MNYKIDEIESVEIISDGLEEKEVYDIGMEDTPNTFFANDILVHNSMYIDVGKILKSFNYTDINDIKKCKTFIDKQIVPLLDRIIEPAMEHLAKKRMNAPLNKIFFKREMIARTAIFLCKKNYVAWVMNMEGNDISNIEDPTLSLKAKGIELVKATSTRKIKDLMRDYIFSLIHNVNYNLSNDKMKEIKNKFEELTVEEISKIGNIKQFNKYLDYNGMPIKGATGAAKAAARYNFLLKEKKIEHLYDPIIEGDKIKLVYLKNDNKYKYDSIAFKDNLPKEFELHSYVDYDIMYEKVLLEPLKRFYDILLWQIPSFDQEDISQFFIKEE